MRRRRRSRRRLRVALLVLLGLCALAAAALGAFEYLAPGEVLVPPLEGRPVARARARLESLGLSLRVTGREHHFGAPPGEVVEQRPRSGRLREGDAVEVTLSAGLPLLELPRLEGRRLDEATAMLAALGFEVGRVSNSYSGRPEGEVIGQSPGRGEARWGSDVDLVVSKGPEPVAVPSVERLSARRARERLRRAGLDVALERTYSNRIAPGRVVYTTPTAGEVVPGGTEVTLALSLGPRFEEVTVPDVRDLGVARARALLAARGLRARVVRSCGGGRTVVETDPIQGATARENDLVALFVC